MSKSYLLFFLFSIPFSSFLQAQAPQVLSTIPANQSITALPQTSITIAFDQALDIQTIDYASFRLFGRWSGPMAFAFSMSNDNHDVELIPEESFFAGEWVVLNISTALKAANGSPMEKGYTIGFWIATTSGTLLQTFVEEIPLRMPGEGLLQTYGAYAGDLNNDGYTDLTTVNETSDDLRILLNDGSGSYHDWTLYDMGNGQPSPSEGADFNNDGEIDLVVTTAHGDEVRVLLGDGEGSFQSMDIYTAGEAARGVAILDLEGNGNDDIIVTNRDNNNITLLTNDGTGAFSILSSDLDPSGTGETAVVVTDANNDGIADAFVGNYYSEELCLYLGDGEGGLFLSDKIAVQGSPWMIAAGDLNGDGFADVASANSNADIMVVSFGDGAGGLSPSVNYSSAGASFPLAIDIGDLDGDGDLDIVTSNYSSASFVVFENEGAGIFSVAATLSAPHFASCAILHDRDNDGDLDITGTDEGDDVVLIFENGMSSSSQAASGEKMRIRLLPNPIHDFLIVDMGYSPLAISQAALYNLQGMKVAAHGEGAFVLQGTRLVLDMRTLPAG
ncbi:MAG TPA: hypothetical protein ENJ45_02310, partial [Phaeodactylibacter sp.]|nr:hypothetical protein [Phaeodactylibacter sp.]